MLGCAVLLLEGLALLVDEFRVGGEDGQEEGQLAEVEQRELRHVADAERLGVGLPVEGRQAEVHGTHARLVRTCHIPVQLVADEECLVWLDPGELGEDEPQDFRVGLADADIAGDYELVEELADLEVALRLQHLDSLEGRVRVAAGRYLQAMLFL